MSKSEVLSHRVDEIVQRNSHKHYGDVNVTAAFCTFVRVCARRCTKNIKEKMAMKCVYLLMLLIIVLVVWYCRVLSSLLCYLLPSISDAYIHFCCTAKPPTISLGFTISFFRDIFFSAVTSYSNFPLLMTCPKNAGCLL